MLPIIRKLTVCMLKKKKKTEKESVQIKKKQMKYKKW